MNSATLLAINLHLKRAELLSQAGGAPARLTVFWDPADEQNARDFIRMLRPWVSRFAPVEGRRAELSELPGLIESDPDAIVAYVTSDFDAAAATSRDLGRRFVAPVVPDVGSLGFGLMQEVESHDYELGGLNEWNGAPTSFSPFVLQSLSLVHTKKSFPNLALADIRALWKGGAASIRVVDIGCGPISRLRWGALEGMMTIIGVDPLNDLYDVVIERHGYSALPHIRPEKCLTEFAEDLDFGGDTFDLFYSCNALDHTQDVDRAFTAIKKGLTIGGAAVLVINTREGERQQYVGLHKYNLWIEDKTIKVSEQDASVRDLLAAVGGLHLENIYWNNESFACLLRRV